MIEEDNTTDAASFDFSIEPSSFDRVQVVETLDTDLVGALAARCN